MICAILEEGFAWKRQCLSSAEVRAISYEALCLQESSEGPNVRNIFERGNGFIDLSKRLAEIAELPDSFRPVRAILFDKTAALNWTVAWHQDLTIALKSRAETGCCDFGPWSIKNGIPHVQAPNRILEEMVTLRLHLDDTPADNGALRVIPGSHSRGILTSVQINAILEKENVLCCDADAGDLLIMSPLLLHGSSRAVNPMSRRVIHMEYAPEEILPEGLEWHEDFG